MKLPIDTKLTAINSPEFIQRTKKRVVIREAAQTFECHSQLNRNSTVQSLS